VVTSPLAEPVVASEASSVPSTAGVAVGAQPAPSASSAAAGVHCKQSKLQMVFLMILFLLDDNVADKSSKDVKAASKPASAATGKGKPAAKQAAGGSKSSETAPTGQ